MKNDWNVKSQLHFVFAKNIWWLWKCTSKAIISQNTKITNKKTPGSSPLVFLAIILEIGQKIEFKVISDLTFHLLSAWHQNGNSYRKIKGWKTNQFQKPFFTLSYPWKQLIEVWDNEDQLYTVIHLLKDHTHQRPPLLSDQILDALITNPYPLRETFPHIKPPFHYRRDSLIRREPLYKYRTASVVKWLACSPRVW